jgi:hypothetical protein
MPQIDFTQVKGQELLPDGVYLVKAVHAEEGLSAQQQPKIDLRWEVIAPEEHNGRIIFDSLSFHPDALWRTKMALTALGFDENFNGEITANDILGREAAVSVGVEKGKINPENNEAYPDRNRVRKVMPTSKYGGGNGTAASALQGLNVPQRIEEEKSAEVTPARRTVRRGQ